MEDYRVQLDFYDGPMDLLLYLVRKDEIDIHDIPIARITEQYCHYVDMLRVVDINLAGEFVALAAWLLEIKTRMLLPAGPPPDESADGTGTTAAAELLDPRAELVRQLLAYKRFKDLAGQLGAAAAAQALKYPRAGIDWQQLVGQPPEPALDLEEVHIWDLLAVFSKLMAQTGRLAPHQVVYDDTPIHEHAAEILERIGGGAALPFEAFFQGRNRGEMIGLFLAMLELIRQKRIEVRQAEPFGPIVIALRPAGQPAGPTIAQSGPADEPPTDQPSDRPRGRPKPGEQVGVTWIADEEEEPLDQELRQIDRELKAIRIAEAQLDHPPPPPAPAPSEPAPPPSPPTEKQG